MEGSSLSRGDLLNSIRGMDPEDQLQLLEDIAAMVKNRLGNKKHSILELRGLGKEIWEGIDAAEYVERERNSWGG